MPDSNVLDKALNIVAGFQKNKEDTRNNIMRTILPEVLQPGELKQAAAPMKEESTKSLHATKYDRRMKFNTALDRSTNSTTSEELKKPKEDPEWMKEAAKRAFDTSSFDGSGVTGREGVITVEDELLKTPPLPTEDPPEYDVGNKPVMQKESTLDLPMDKGVFLVAEPTASEKALPIVGGIGMGLLPMTGALFNNPSPTSLGIAGLASTGIGLGTYGLLRYRQNKHREQAQKLVDRLNAIGSSPMDDFARAEIAGASKIAKEESFAQRNPVTMSALGALGGSVLGAIPGHFLGGHIKVKMDFRRHAKAMAAAEEKVRRAEQVASDWETRYDTHWKKNPGYSDMKAHEEWRNNIPDNKEQRRNYENSSNARREHLRIMLGRPFEWVSRREGSEIGTPIGAAVGGGLGALGGYKASRPDEKKKVAQPKTASDLYSKVANSSYIRNNLDHLRQYGPDVLEAAQAIMESKEQDALEAGVHKAYHHVKEHRVKEANDASFKGVYPEESFTQRHPAVLPIGLGLLGATVGAVPGAFLGGRAAVRSATKAYQRNLDDVGEAYQRAMNTYNRADNSTPQIVIEKIKENLRNTRNAYRKVKESPPEPGYHRALGQVGGGLLGGLTGGGLGTLGGLELNKPQPWE